MNYNYDQYDNDSKFVTAFLVTMLLSLLGFCVYSIYAQDKYEKTEPCSSFADTQADRLPTRCLKYYTNK